MAETTRDAAVQSTEATPESPTDLDADQRHQFEWAMKRAHQAHRDEDHALGTLLENLAAQIRALAAERDRADRAEKKLTSALDIADVWIESELSDPAPISVVMAGRVFRGLLTSQATA